MDRLRDSVIYFYGQKSSHTCVPKNGVVKPAEQSNKDNATKSTSNSSVKSVDSYADNLVQTLVNEVVQLSLTKTGMYYNELVYPSMWSVMIKSNSSNSR